MRAVDLPPWSERGAEAHAAEPQRRLMAAVLQTALDDCQGAAFPGATRRGAVRRAVAYVASRDRRWPFSFENLCEALALDAGSLRQLLRKEPDA